MFLALAPLESSPRPCHVSPAELGAIVAELERDDDFPARVAGRCALCHGVLAAGEADGTGVAHRICAEDVMNEIDFDSGFGDDDERFASWVNSCESTYGNVR